MTEEHLGGSWETPDVYTYWPDIWERFVESYDIGSVIDLGCGRGHNLKWFYGRGLRCQGVEGDQEAVHANVCPKEIIVTHDYSKGPYIPDEEFDLCLATEFVEHVEKKYERNWIATTLKCRWLMMCHATPGQAGHHHVNCERSEYWIDRLKEFGWEIDIRESGVIRATGKFIDGHWAGWDYPWGRPTALVFKR